MLRTLQRESGFGELHFRSYQIRFLTNSLSESVIESYQPANCRDHSALMELGQRQLWPIDSRTEKFAVVI
jgi:hypothetical protein